MLQIDDLPVIRDNIRKGFEDTQTKVNSWVQNLKKRWDGDEMDEEQPGRSYSQGYHQGYSEDQIYSGARRSGDLGRRSGDRERYDADPQLLDDNFAALELRDSEGPSFLSFSFFLSFFFFFFLILLFSDADHDHSSPAASPTTSREP